MKAWDEHFFRYNIAMNEKQIKDNLKAMRDELDVAIKKQNLDTSQAELAALEKEIGRADFWQQPEQAEVVSQKAAELKRFISSWYDLRDEIATLLELVELDSGESEKELLEQYEKLKKLYDTQMNELLFSGDYDKLPAIVQISAGVGGTDAQDWAQMLQTMYIKYANSAGLKVAVVDTSYGEEAGIKSSTLEISGHYAYGKLRSEKGVHRLVRLSPFNSDNLRQTSFALVDVIPEIPENSVELDEKDLKIDTYRSSGHGGQSVNTTDSAVRVTHLPSGLTVAIQNERSQLKNKQKALSILASKLSELAREQHLQSVADIRGQQKSADWGSQIRSYVLHPYNKVKDHRSGHETSDTTGVLGGNLDEFILAYLRHQVGQ